MAVPRIQSNSAVPHRFGHSRELFNGFAFNRQTNKRRRYLRVGGGGIKQRAEKIRCFNAAEILAAHEAQCRLAQFEITGINCVSAKFICSGRRREQPSWSGGKMAWRSRCTD